MYQAIPMYRNYASPYWNAVQPTWQPYANYWPGYGGPYRWHATDLNHWNHQVLYPDTWNLHARGMGVWNENDHMTVSRKNLRERVLLQDYGAKPFVIDIEDATVQNETFRTALWTGKHLQLTLMSIPVGEEIGLELHPETDQFLRIEQGQGMVFMGEKQDDLSFQRKVEEDDVILVPAGYWHNLRNTGNQPLKLYSIYAPPEHPFGTVHETKADALAAEMS